MTHYKLIDWIREAISTLAIIPMILLRMLFTIFCIVVALTLIGLLLGSAR